MQPARQLLCPLPSTIVANLIALEEAKKRAIIRSKAVGSFPHGTGHTHSKAPSRAAVALLMSELTKEQ